MSRCTASFATSYFFFFTHTATTEIYTLSLHDALPISRRARAPGSVDLGHVPVGARPTAQPGRQLLEDEPGLDRKSTRLNSSHTVISYAVFCLKKKKNPARNKNCHDSHSHDVKTDQSRV